MMESRREENPNPWKHKSRLRLIGFLDIVIALLGIAYSSYRMFTFYWSNQTHVPIYIVMWIVVVLMYSFQIGISFVLYSAINQEATETDPYISIQKCNCWLRCSRVVLGVVVTKLCLQPVIIYLTKIYWIYGICIGIAELCFRTAAMIGVKRFIQELQH